MVGLGNLPTFVRRNREQMCKSVHDNSVVFKKKHIYKIYTLSNKHFSLRSKIYSSSSYHKLLEQYVNNLLLCYIVDFVGGGRVDSLVSLYFLYSQAKSYHM